MSVDPDKLARTPLGRSEMSHGQGMFPNPDINYEDGRVDQDTASVNNTHRTIDSQLLDLAAYRRLDSTRTGGESLRDMYFASGNTDRFGANPPLVNAHDRKTRRDRGPKFVENRMRRAD